MAISSMHDSQGIYILGDPFLRTFTTTFDYREKIMLVGINANAPSGARIVSKLSYLEIFCIVLACIVVAGAVGLCGFCIWKKNKLRREARMNQVGGGAQGGYKGVWVRRDSEKLINRDEEITETDD